MGLFSALIRTAVNVATLPVSVIKDCATLGGSLIDEESAVVQKLEQIKREAE